MAGLVYNVDFEGFNTASMKLLGSPDNTDGKESVVEKIYDRHEKLAKAIRILLIVAIVSSLVMTTTLAFADLDEIPGGDFSYFGGAVGYNQELSEKAVENGTESDYGELDDWVAGLLRPGVDFLISTSRGMIRSTVKAELLNRGFEELSSINGAFDTFQQIHHTVVVPMGNVVVIVMFVVALVKLFSNSSAAEAFIDVWKLMMTFIMFCGALILINASWEIMVMFYDLVLKMINGIYEISSQNYVTDTMGRVTGTITNLLSGNGSSTSISSNPTANIHQGGNMVAALIAALILFLAGLACAVIANVMIIVRAIEIYLYACFSPIAFGFIISEGGRQMTESFFKRYLAVLLAGAIQVIMLLLMSLASHSFGMVPAGTGDDFGSQLAAMLLTTIPCIACIFLMTKSTQVAKDILGVN